MKDSTNRFNFLISIFLITSFFVINTALADYVLVGTNIVDSQNNVVGTLSSVVNPNTGTTESVAVDRNGNPLANQKIISSETGAIYNVTSDGKLIQEGEDENKDENGNPILPFQLGAGGTGGSASSGTGTGTGSSGTGTGTSGSGTGSSAANSSGATPPEPNLASDVTSVSETVSPGSPIFDIAGEMEVTGSNASSATSRSSARTLGDKVKRVGDTSTRENSMLDSFDGWSTLYRGTRNTSLMVDPYKLSEQYPELFYSEREDSNRPSLGKEYTLPKNNTDNMDSGNADATDIGVDDEILKTSMSIYQPIRRMQKDFLEDQAARNAYLDNALTVRGIAIMTMGFLDKTVGAGLTSIQQQADQETVQNLLKQISWTTSKMANPDRAQIYRDTDEKLEACLEVAFQSQAPTASIQGLSRKIVSFDCDEKKCGTAPVATKPYRTTTSGETAYKQQGNGTYAYCVCCAETKDELNKINENNPDTGVRYSLASRLFYGTKKPTASTLKMTRMLNWFRKTYGDVIVQNKTAGGPDKIFTYAYVPPEYSVRRLAAAFNDGCKEPNSAAEVVFNDTPGTNCPMILRDFKIKYGICPALVNVLHNWRAINNRATRTTEHVRMLLEASMGLMLTANDVENLLGFNGGEPDGLPAGKEPTDGMRRWIRNFCNASSFTAVTRFHTKQSQIINDHLILNQQLTSIEKGKILELMSRVSQHIALAEKDSSSSYPVEALLEGLLVKTGRENIGKQAAISGASGAMKARVGEIGSILTWGVGVGDYFAGASGGSGTVVGREADPITRTLDEIKP